MSGLASKCCESNVAARMFCNMTRQGCLAGARIAEQSKHLSAAVFQPAINREQRRILFRGPLYRSLIRRRRLRRKKPFHGLAIDIDHARCMGFALHIHGL